MNTNGSTAALEPLLTPRVLKIPAAVARKYAVRAREQGLDSDDLESAANLAFATALTSFDAAEHPAGEGGLPSWLLNAVEWKVRNLIWPPRKDVRERLRRDRTVSLDAPSQASSDSGNDHLDLLGVLVCPDGGSPESLVDAHDEAASVLARLGPIQAAVVRLVCQDGLSHREAGERLLVSGSRIEQILSGARRKAVRSAQVRDAHRAAGYRPSGAAVLADPARRAGALHQKRRANYYRAREQMVRARRALGVLRLDGWYLIDRAARTAWGDWPRMAEALAAVGVTMESTRARGPDAHLAASLGWPSLMPCEAVMLDVLVREGRPLTNAQLAGLRPGLPPHPLGVSDVASRLVRMGLASSTGRSRKGGSRRSLYGATPLALAERGPTTDLEPLRGYGLRELLDGAASSSAAAACWRVLPPHLVTRRCESTSPMKEAR